MNESIRNFFLSNKREREIFIVYLMNNKILYLMFLLISSMLTLVPIALLASLFGIIGGETSLIPQIFFYITLFALPFASFLDSKYRIVDLILHVIPFAVITYVVPKSILSSKLKDYANHIKNEVLSYHVEGNIELHEEVKGVGEYRTSIYSTHQFLNHQSL